MKITEVDRLWRKAEQSVKASVATGPASHAMGTGKKHHSHKKEKKKKRKENDGEEMSEKEKS